MRNRVTPIRLATGRWGAIDEAASVGVVVRASQQVPHGKLTACAERLPAIYLPRWLAFDGARDAYHAHLTRRAQLVEREVHALAMKHRGRVLVLMGREHAVEQVCARRWFAEWWQERNPDDLVPEVCDRDDREQLALELSGVGPAADRRSWHEQGAFR